MMIYFPLDNIHGLHPVGGERDAVARVRDQSGEALAPGLQYPAGPILLSIRSGEKLGLYLLLCHCLTSKRD